MSSPIEPSGVRRELILLEEISRILWEDWAPIGCGVPPDEYDSYVCGVYRVLASGASQETLVEHLRRVERSSIGGCSGGVHEAARKLSELIARAPEAWRELGWESSSSGTGPFHVLFFRHKYDRRPHVYVERDGHTAWFSLSPITFRSNKEFSRSDLQRIKVLLHEHEAVLAKSWNESSGAGHRRVGP